MKSHFVDTNYFLRFILKDNKAQFNEAYELFKTAALGDVKLITSEIVFFEIYWVLESFYSQKKSKHLSVLHKILKMGFVEISNREVLRSALKLYKNVSVELEDCYNIIYAKVNDCDKLASFDKKLLRLY